MSCNFTRDFAALRCYLLPAKIEFCHPDFFSHHERIYHFWYDTIYHALHEEKNFNMAESLSSEAFIENDEMVALFHHDQPIGLFMFRWINTIFTINRQLQALQKRFPQHFVNNLINNKKSHMMLMGHLAVNVDWRQKKIGLGVSDLLMYFAVTRFLESRADVLLTTTRNNRRTNALCYRQGGKKIENLGKVLGVDSDLVLFHRQDVTPLPDENLKSIAQTLWGQKQHAWIHMLLWFVDQAALTEVRQR